MVSPALHGTSVERSPLRTDVWRSVVRVPTRLTRSVVLVGALFAPAAHAACPVLGLPLAHQFAFDSPADDVFVAAPPAPPCATPPAPSDLLALGGSSVRFEWRAATEAGNLDRIHRDGRERERATETAVADDSVGASAYHRYAVTAPREHEGEELELAAAKLDPTIPGAERASNTGSSAEGSIGEGDEPTAAQSSERPGTSGSGTGTIPAGPGSLPPPGDDSVYGTQIVGGRCPGIPASFPEVHRVTSHAEFVDAYRRARPGEAVVVAGGVRDWTSRVRAQAWAHVERPLVLDRIGTAAKPIYVLAEKVHGTVFRDNGFTFVLAGRHNVFAGFDFDRARTLSVFVDGPDNRVACNRFGGGESRVSVAQQGAHRTEIDNNHFERPDRYAMMLMRCMPTQPTCRENSKYHHIHHNTWRDKPSAGKNGHEAIILGLGYAPVPGVTIYTSAADGPEGTNMRALVENNLFDNWNGENELISVKSGGNLIRNNCIVNSPAAGIKIRTGYDNLVTGNWFENSNHGGQEISGKRNYFAFNYYSHSRRSIQLAQGVRYSPSFDGGKKKDLLFYISGDDNVVSHNVFGRTRHMISVGPRTGGARYHRGAPQGNVLEGNLYLTNQMIGTDSAGSYRSTEGKVSESVFRKNNTWGYNEVVREEPSSSQCGDSRLFDGPGGSGATVSGNPLLYGSPERIQAPSWW